LLWEDIVDSQVGNVFKIFRNSGDEAKHECLYTGRNEEGDKAYL
jgi:hypothetical protein